MARQDQIIGLNERGRKLVEGAQREVVGTYTGMFGDPHDLMEYRFRDGRVFTEYVQTEPWSSGPCFFIALKDNIDRVVPESLWAEEEIEAML